MAGKEVRGSCFCKAVRYRMTGNMGVFQYCHCSRCQKVTGTAHAANLFVAPADFEWMAGEENVRRYDPPETKYFATAFCATCGSPLPWLSKGGQVVVVPAGSLDEDPGIRPTQNVYCGSRSAWYVDAGSLPQNEEMPPRN